MGETLYPLKKWFEEPKDVRTKLENEFEGFPLRDKMDYVIRFTPESIRCNKKGHFRLASEVDEDEWMKRSLVVIVHNSWGDSLSETVKIKAYAWRNGMAFEDDETRFDVEDALGEELLEHIVPED